VAGYFLGRPDLLYFCDYHHDHRLPAQAFIALFLPYQPLDCAPVPSSEAILGRSVDLARSQLVAQSARLDALDLKAFALLGLDAALVAALIAAKGDLGRRWWLALIGIGFSILLGSIAAAGNEAGVKLGPEPDDFQESADWHSDGDFLEQLLVRLQRSLNENKGFEDHKRSLVSVGGTLLLLTGVYSAFVFAFWR
jgi:hypothetical protein